MAMTDFKKLSSGDEAQFATLIQLFNVVFETANPAPINNNQLLKLLSNSAFISFVAIDNNEIVGGLTAYELPSYYSEQSEAYLYDIAVKPEFQRAGIGKQLISTLTEYCKQNNIAIFFVEAHEEDQEAVDFYHKIEGQAERIIHFNFLLK